ncbi:MAG: hypothetical protein FWH17_00350 [Oscillospiraceae bacterium]|nr:hypothetical protein [Oscillospiraceae bacterium]
MMLLNIIMAASFAPILPLIYIMMRNTIKPKKNIIIGTTLPVEAQTDPDVTSICDSFKKWLGIATLLLIPLLVPPFFMSSFGVAMTWYMTWMVLLVVAHPIVFAVHRGRLMTLKNERGWRSSVAGQRLAEVKLAGIPVYKINNIWFLLALAVSLVPVLYVLLVGGKANAMLMPIYLTFAGTVALFWGLYYIIYHIRAEVFNEDLTLTMALTRVRRYNWGKFWIIASWITAAYNLAVWAFAVNETGILIATLVYSVIIIIISLQTEFATRAAQQKLTASDTGDVYADEDEYWFLGLIYYNPNDKQFLVNDRIGMNMSMNVAKPAGKVLMFFTALIIVAMPFLGLWMLTEERTPVNLVIDGSMFTVEHTRIAYSFPLGEIDSVELIFELPVMTKTNGSNFENLYKGNFNARGYGAVTVCMLPQNPPFLVIKIQDGTTYIFNDTDSNVTTAVYRALTP